MEDIEVVAMLSLSVNTHCKSAIIKMEKQGSYQMKWMRSLVEIIHDNINSYRIWAGRDRELVFVPFVSR